MASKTIITPRGIARWPFLNKPYTQFKPDGEFKVTLELDMDDDDAKEFITKMDEVVAKKKLKNHPYTVKDGKASFKFASNYKPQLFDSHGNKVAEELPLGSGSVIQCAVEPSIYDGFGGGIKLYLKAVQVIELVEYSGASAEDYGFGQVEGGFSADTFEGVAEADDTPEVPEDDFKW
jgi:hypothetical protein